MAFTRTAPYRNGGPGGGPADEATAFQQNAIDFDELAACSEGCRRGRPHQDQSRLSGCCQMPIRRSRGSSKAPSRRISSGFHTGKVIAMPSQPNLRCSTSI